MVSVTLLVPVRLDFENGDLDAAVLGVGMGPEDRAVVAAAQEAFASSCDRLPIRSVSHVFAWERRAQLCRYQTLGGPVLVAAAETEPRYELSELALLVNARQLSFEGVVAVRGTHVFAKLRTYWYPWPPKD